MLLGPGRTGGLVLVLVAVTGHGLVLGLVLLGLGLVQDLVVLVAVGLGLGLVLTACALVLGADVFDLAWWYLLPVPSSLAPSLGLAWLSSLVPALFLPPPPSLLHHWECGWLESGGACCAERSAPVSTSTVPLLSSGAHQPGIG